ncbi:MAG: tetratricopeptide repeat protein, partial [Bacteroidota bacterium]
LLPDTLERQLGATDPEKKVQAHLSAYKLLRFKNSEEALKIWKQGVMLAKKHKLSKPLGYFYRERGIYYYNNGSFDTALVYMDSLYQVGMAARDSSLIGKSLDNMGGINFMRKDYNKSLECYLKGLRYYEGRKDMGIPGIYVNIGLLYQRIDNNMLAVKYLEAAIKAAQEYSDTSVIVKAYNNLGIMEREKKAYDKALSYFRQALRMAEPAGLKEDMSDLYHNIGTLFISRGDYRQALVYAEKAMKITMEMGRDFGLIDSYTIFGEIYLKMKNYKEAEKYLFMAEAEGIKYEFYDQLVIIYTHLARLYDETGNDSRKADMLERSIASSDSAMVRNNLEAMQNLQLQFSVFMKEREDSIKRAEQARVYQLEIDQQNQRLRSQRIYLSGGVLVLVLALATAFISYRAYTNKKTANEEINKQKTIIEVKNKEILDSINYAKRLQDAIIPSRELIKSCFPGHFVFYRPKDIVSGDYYWVSQQGDHSLIAAIDCTGHGVPGAFLSIIAGNALNKIVNERREVLPASILYQLHDEVKSTLGRDAGMNDGMDVSLCSYNKKTGKLLYAGARNAMYLFRNGAMEEYSAAKRSIGETIEAKVVPFTNTTLELKQGDIFYLFTDGYVDQFGGPKGKKYKYKKLKESLSSLAPLPVAEQEMKLHRDFEDWKGNMEQVDDVLVIGVRV